KISRRHAFRQVVRGGVDVVNRPVAARARWRMRVFDDQREDLRIFGRALPKKRRRLVLALLGKAFRHRRAIWKRAAGKGECHRKPRWIVTLKLRTGSPVPWCLGRFKRHFGCAEPCRPPWRWPERPKDARGDRRSSIRTIQNGSTARQIKAGCKSPCLLRREGT